MLVYNNKPEDEKCLASFGEPSWNNPVMRFLDARGEDVLPRRDRLWSRHQVAARLGEALAAAGRPVPAWLSRARDELAPSSTLSFAMHCYWVGEARLGGLDGVIATRAGWAGGDEVVQVQFDPSRMDAARLAARAAELDCASKTWAHDASTAKALGVPLFEGTMKDASASDQWYHLRRDAVLRVLPCTPSQATKLNAALATEPKLDLARMQQRGLISPRQAALAARLKAGPGAAKEAGDLATLRPPREIDALDEYWLALEARLEAAGR